MELLATQPGLRYVNEPFRGYLVAKAGLPTGLEHILPPTETKILAIPPDAQERFRTYLTDPRATRNQGPYNPFSPTFHFSTNRRVLKMLHASSVIEWIDDQQLGLDIVYLLRHPVPNVLSMTTSVAVRLEANLRHERFVARFLTPQQVELGWSILREGSKLEQFALQWCIDNLGPYRAVQAGGRDWTVLTYEELSLSPRQSVDLLAERLHLEQPEQMLRQMDVPSASTAQARVGALQSETAEKRVLGWRRRVDEDTEERIFSICDMFGIDAYERGAGVARPEWLNFADTPRLR